MSETKIESERGSLFLSENRENGRGSKQENEKVRERKGEREREKERERKGEREKEKGRERTSKGV